MTNIPSIIIISLGERVLLLKDTYFHADTDHVAPVLAQGLYTVPIDDYSRASQTYSVDTAWTDGAGSRRRGSTIGRLKYAHAEW